MMPTNVFADEPIKVFVDGEKLDLSVPQVVERGSTLVPFRAIFEKLNFNVTWDSNTKTIIGTKDGLKLQMQINNTSAIVNGEAIVLGTPPNIINGSTYVPLRFVGEASGDVVAWDGINKVIQINNSAASEIPKDSENGQTQEPAKLEFLERNKPYTSKENDMTVVVTSINVVDKGQFYEYSITYDQKNNTSDKAIDEATFKIYYENGESEAQYGFFGKLMPTESITRTYVFKATKSQIAYCLEYGTKTFFSTKPAADSLKWEVQ